MEAFVDGVVLRFFFQLIFMKGKWVHNGTIFTLNNIYNYFFIVLRESMSKHVQTKNYKKIKQKQN